MAQAKELRITLTGDSKQPTYAFDGGWTGHDVASVVRGLTRAYRIHTRDMRRSVPSDKSTTPAKEAS